MMNQFEARATPGVKGLHPYQPGKPIDELQREHGVSDVVKLASNENPLGPSLAVLAALQNRVAELARYPDGNGFELKQVLAAKHSVDMAKITLGTGSSDPLEFVVRVFVQPGDEVVFSEHAFAMYPIISQAASARAVVTPAKNWGHDLDAMRAAVTDRTRVIFIANPNNPTGTWLSSEALQAFIAAIPERVMVVVDEAYFEFASDSALGAVDYPDATQWLNRFPNLMVTRTFSKAYGLAGLRVGYSLSHPDVANLLNRIRPPFNVNSLALAAACASLNDEGHMRRGVALNAEQMHVVTAAVKKMGLDFIPSVGNFVCIDVGENAAEVYEALLHEGVIVRPVANYGMPRHLRVTLGLPEENARFLTALEKVRA
ncbi:MAG: histidinol-phosphate transaminase [Gammaproteobacteria bacterium]|nr:histidinol-phosphate transaminase [Gammaproteobacteria bacterium]